MREVEFKMEREGLLNEGDDVEVEEQQHLTRQGMMVYYTIIPAFAMSNNIPYAERLNSFKGKVTKIVPNESASFVTVQFD